jgi:hypothetical protein
MKKHLFFVSMIALFIASVACRDPKKARLEELIPAAYLNNPTTIAFEDTSFNFGNIKQGDKVKHTFKFTNSGKNPLLIVNSFGTCGCTVPDYPKNPIKPGESGVINVVFNSEGKEGLQHKKVIVIANTGQNKNVVNFTAMVNKP